MQRILTIAAALAVAAAPAGFAKGGPPPGHGRGQAKSKQVVAKGTVAGYDATAHTLVVTVSRTNHAGSALKGTDVTFDVTNARMTASQILAGDKVVVKFRMTKDQAGPYAARQVVDQTHPPVADAGDDDAQDEAAPQS